MIDLKCMKVMATAIAIYNTMGLVNAVRYLGTYQIASERAVDLMAFYDQESDRLMGE